MMIERVTELLESNGIEYVLATAMDDNGRDRLIFPSVGNANVPWGEGLQLIIDRHGRVWPVIKDGYAECIKPAISRPGQVLDMLESVREAEYVDLARRASAYTHIDLDLIKHAEVYHPSYLSPGRESAYK